MIDDGDDDDNYILQVVPIVLYQNLYLREQTKISNQLNSRTKFVSHLNDETSRIYIYVYI